MTVVSRAVGAVSRLPRAQTHRVKADKGIRIPMSDGVELYGERWYPDVAGGDRLPVLVVRSPYGPMGIIARLIAERGYQVLYVQCRGTFASDGEWRPYFNEREDGHATLRWLSEQRWFPGTAGLFGASYLGLTEWAVMDDLPDFVKGAGLGVTSSNFRKLFYPGGSFALESAYTWASGLAIQELPVLKRLLATRRATKAASATLLTSPLADVDSVGIGSTVDLYQDWLDHEEPDDPFWAPIDFGTQLDRVPPSVLIAGWYDLFLPDQLDDFVALKQAGRDVRLRVGPWTHASRGGAPAMIRHTLELMDERLKGQPRTSADVSVFVMGANRWVDLPAWPPPASRTRYHLHADGRLATSAPQPSAPTRYRYDPSDPTPGVGGGSLFGQNAGPKDQTAVEARPDVLTFTTDVLSDDVTVIGPVTADLHVRSSLDHTDFFVRLCAVSAKGRSTNICDGIVRVRPGVGAEQDDGTIRLQIRLFPTANTFRRGHRIRLQVSSGAHPLYARNTGSGEPLGKATTFVIAEQEVFHDPEHPSAIELPIVPTVRPAGRVRRLRAWLR